MYGLLSTIDDLYHGTPSSPLGRVEGHTSHLCLKRHVRFSPCLQRGSLSSQCFFVCGRDCASIDRVKTLPEMYDPGNLLDDRDELTDCLLHGFFLPLLLG